MSGDLVLEVNGKDLRTAPYAQVAYTLKVRDLRLQKKDSFLSISI